MLEAYFDETERPETRAFCMAGHVYTPVNAKSLSKAWDRALKGRAWRSASASHPKDDFEGMSRSEIDSIRRKLIDIVRRHMSLGVVISCNINEVASLHPKGMSPKRFTYMLCAHIAMAAVGDYARALRGQRAVSFFFDQGHEAMGATNDLIRKFVANPAGTDLYRYVGHSFEPSSAVAPLQAADMLAYECGRVWDDRIYTQKRPLRASAREMFRDKLDQFIDLEVRGELLETFVRQFEEMWESTRG